MAEGKLFTVNPPISRNELDAAGQLKKVYDITFITRSGARDTITVDAKDYDPVEVRAEITRLAEMHEEVTRG